MGRVGKTAALVLPLLVFPTHFPPRMAAPELAADPAPPLRILRGTIPPNSSLARTLADELSPAVIHELVEAARPAYDLGRVAVGHAYGLALEPEGALAAFTYAVDELKTLRVARHRGRLQPEFLSREYERTTGRIAGVIRSSLFEAVLETGESEQLALDLADIFAWDVDFNTELRKGDSFRVAVEKLSLDGRFRRYGRVLAAEFTRGRTLQAVYFEGAGRGGYYTPEGIPLRKAFLRSPLRFSRISSGFSRRRLHPILKKRRPHLGIDYAAPRGTPVHAAADGVVSGAGWMGGYGKAVRLRHANGFGTLYGHLSRIAVRRGQRVAQGALIGRVGATGLATGPHLDYRMTRNGVFVNPLRVQLPPAEPVAPEERASFERQSRARLALLPARPRGMPVLVARAHSSADAHVAD